MENGFKRIKKIAKRVLPQITDSRMSSTSINSVVTTMGNDALSEFVVSADMKHSPGIEAIAADGTEFGCQFFDSDEDDEECSDLDHFQDSENVMEASTSFLSSMKDLEGIDPETRARLQVLFEAAGLVKTNPTDGGLVANQKLIRKLTSSVSEALDEAASALIKMKEEQVLEREEPVLLNHPDKNTEAVAQQLLKQHGSSLGKNTEDGESLLSMAASSGYYELCQVLLATNADVDDRGAKGDCTPLMEAAAGGFVDIIQLLLHNKASINAKSTAGNTALHYAASGGHKKAVQILINAGAHVEAANENGHTPLMEAASVGHVGVAKLLIENGAEVNTQSREFKESALTLACYKGHTEMVQFLLNAGADLEHKTDEMHTALMEACIDGFAEVAKLLIERGAEVNMIPESYESPLTLAACGGHVELASLLISKGAIVDQRNDEGYTPLMEAAREGHVEVSALLLEHGADVNAITQESKETALTLACCSGFLEMADLLLRKGADLELGGLSPLIEAAQEGHLYLVKYLLNIGANVNAVSQRGDTALSCACGNGHTNVAEVLLKAGSNLEHVSNNGRTPLMKAAKMGHLLTVQFLVRRGAVVNKSTPDNEYTALSLACIGGHLKVVEFLLQNGANAAHKLKDGSTMLIEAAKGGHAQIVSLLLDWSAMLSSNPSLSEKLKTDLWRMSSKEQAVKKSHIKKALLQLESMPKNLGYADGEEGTYCPEKCCTRTNHARNSIYQNMAMRSLMAKMDEDGVRILSSPKKNSLDSRESETCKNKLLQKDFELKEGVRHEGDGCSGGIDSAVHDLSGSSSVSSSSSSSSSSSASEVEKFEDACFCCCTSEKPEASIERGESLASTVESRKRACLDHFDEGDSAFSLKAETNVPCGNVSAQINLSSDPSGCERSISSIVQNRIIAKGHRKLPQQPKIAASQQRCQPSNTPPCLTETEKGLIKQKQINTSEISPLVGDVFNLPKPQKILDRCLSSQEKIAEALLRNQQHEAQKTKNPEPLHLKIRSQASKTAERTACNSLGNSSVKTIMSKGKNSNLEKIRLSSGKVAGNQNVVPVQKAVDDNTSLDKTLKIPPSREHSVFPAIEVNAQTEANHDTALTLASAGGHFELVQLLLRRGADVEHRDKKGFTSLILAAAAGHLQVVNVLLEHGSDTEAQLEQTKDTALSLACSGGRHEIAESLLKHGANREHRNASDYTPLCLAASAGHVNIVRLLLIHGAEINSRTSSRLGISPLMLASMNGHAAVVSLLLDMGGDVNAQIETNKNTALTLACFQGKHEVVALLADRKANLEHRAKKGLTPLMEAASGGFVEVGRVLLDRGADVSALHGSSTKDTALIIAADKGHYRFVELLLAKGAPVDARNKKGHTSLWLACNGGHLEVIQLLIKHKADPDSCDVRRTSCLMAAFKKGHVKVVKWLVRRVNQLPSDQECARCLSQIGEDKDLLKKCQQCMDIIINAKERQAAEANKHANNLLLELALEQSLVESKKAAALRKREKRKQKKKDVKKGIDKIYVDDVTSFTEHKAELELMNSDDLALPEGSLCYSKLHEMHDILLQFKDDVNSIISNTNPIKEIHKKNYLSESKSDSNSLHNSSDNELESNGSNSSGNTSENSKPREDVTTSDKPFTKTAESGISDLDDFSLENDMFKLSINSGNSNNLTNDFHKSSSSSDSNASKNNPKVGNANRRTCHAAQAKPSAQGHKIKEDDWKEVSRKCKKLNVPGKCISRIIGRGGCNINAVREFSGAHIDLDKMKHCEDGVITIKGLPEATQLAMKLLVCLIEDPEKDIEQLIPSYKGVSGKASKPHTTNLCPDVSKEIVKSTHSSTSIPLSPINSIPKLPIAKSQESDDKSRASGNVLCIGQSPSDSNFNIFEPWSVPKSNTSKVIQRHITDKSEDNDDLVSTTVNVCRTGSLNSPTPGQYSNDHLKDITSQFVSNSLTSSYYFIGRGEFSPFDNLLSNITETVLQKNKDQKKDFATVAASCLSNGSSMLSNVLLSSASKMMTPEANPALLAKAPGFRRGNQSLKTAQTVAPPSIALEIPYSASLVARRLDFGNGAEIGTSPAGVPGIGESGTNKTCKPGVIGSGIPSFGNIPKKRSYIEDDLKFSAAIGSTLNPNAPNFKSVMSHKNYDHSFSFPPLSQPFAPSVKSQTISNIAFDSLAGKAPPAFDGNPPSFMFDYGPANELWKFSSSESAAIQNGSSDFLNKSLKADSSQFHLCTPNDNYIHGSSFLNGDTCLPKEPRMFQESRYSLNENTFINSMFPSQLDMANSLVSQSLFSAFSSDTPYNQSTEDYFPSLGHPSSHSAGLYQPISSARSYLTNSSLGLPPRSPLTHEWQQLNS